jgi:hypothetical protein
MRSPAGRTDVVQGSTKNFTTSNVSRDGTARGSKTEEKIDGRENGAASIASGTDVDFNPCRGRPGTNLGLFRQTEPLIVLDKNTSFLAF